MIQWTDLNEWRQYERSVYSIIIYYHLSYSLWYVICVCYSFVRFSTIESITYNTIQYNTKQYNSELKKKYHVYAKNAEGLICCNVSI